MCRDVCALFLEKLRTSFLKPYTLNTQRQLFRPSNLFTEKEKEKEDDDSDDVQFVFRCFSHPNEEGYLFLNTAAAAKAQS